MDDPKAGTLQQKNTFNVYFCFMLYIQLSRKETMYWPCCYFQLGGLHSYFFQALPVKMNPYVVIS